MTELNPRTFAHVVHVVTAVHMNGNDERLIDACNWISADNVPAIVRDHGVAFTDANGRESWATTSDWVVRFGPGRFGAVSSSAFAELYRPVVLPED